MTTLADQTIAALRSLHDDLASRLPTLSAEELEAASGCSDWSVEQVVSHLGNGAEINLAVLRAATDGASPPDQAFNEAVWERWDALSPAERVAGYLEHGARLMEAFEALTPGQRAGIQVRVGFLPAPLPLEGYAGLRLSEVALHGWDVAVGLDPAARLDGDAAALILDHYAGGLGFLLGFLGMADQVSERTVVGLGDSALALEIDGGVRLTREAGAPTARFAGDAEATVRLLAGRLGPAYTPAGVDVTGNATLDDLRRVFPGY